MEEEVEMNVPGHMISNASPVQRKSAKVKSSSSSRDQDHHGHSHGSGKQEPSSTASTLLKGILLIALVPLVLSIPFILSFMGNLVLDHQVYLVYLWIAYSVILLYILFYHRRKTHNWRTFGTQLMIWAIFTLGIYTLVDIPRFLDPRLRQTTLYVWLSFTMIFAIGWFLFDDTDWVDYEKKEEEKERKEKLRDEKLKKKWALDEDNVSKNMSPRTKLILNVVIYAVIIGGGAYWLYNYYKNFHEQRDLRLHNDEPRSIFDEED